jgi:hypothetical protein
MIEKNGGKMTWLFDGIGTMLVGIALGGAGGWYFRGKNISRQKQRAGDGATQTQISHQSIKPPGKKS